MPGLEAWWYELVVGLWFGGSWRGEDDGLKEEEHQADERDWSGGDVCRRRRMVSVASLLTMDCRWVGGRSGRAGHWSMVAHGWL